jgi:hypothetical protein
MKVCVFEFFFGLGAVVGEMSIFIYVHIYVHGEI